MEKITPRTGRPTDNPRTKAVNFRMAQDEVELLEYCCEITGKTKTEIINLGIQKVYESIKK